MTMIPRVPRLRLLALAACTLLLANCSHIGRQEPKVFEGKFSPSGRYYAYIYQRSLPLNYRHS